MVLEQKQMHDYGAMLRDVRPLTQKITTWIAEPLHSTMFFFTAAFTIGSDLIWPASHAWADLIFVIFVLYFLWIRSHSYGLPFKLPQGAPYHDPNDDGPGGDGTPKGILYLGNMKSSSEEIWFSNSDARTHILYLGTTGSGKTEGLKSMVTNALTWGSGFVYVDGKADTDLWSSISSMVRRFGRDDDLLVLNYMTGNSDARAPSNTMNPFSSGSASYLTNMLVSLMPEAEGDNAMWKERAVSLISSLMPALTWKRDNQDIPLSVSVIRDYLNLNNVIKLSRDESVPEELRTGVKGYLDTLPGYVDTAFDDEGREKPMGPDQPMVDTTTCRQQHGYLSMQFTRALQSLGDDYGYIFDTQAADVDMVDVVLNRRILVVLIPALEKSSDEIANLGKIVAATLKGMMGSTLGANVEGESATVIENKPTHSATPFMTVFDEVGYYTAQGMAVMAAQARSLGFCLVYSAQDLPALEKRVKEEARSITANCNIKIFGKLEDPTQTKDFFEKTVGQAFVAEISGYQTEAGSMTHSYMDTYQAGLQLRDKADYNELRGFKEGRAIITFGEEVTDSLVFYSNPGHAKAMRVTRFMALPAPEDYIIKNAPQITKLRDLLVNKNWTAERADVALQTEPELEAMLEAFKKGQSIEGTELIDCGMHALAGMYAAQNPSALTETMSSEQLDAIRPSQTVQASAQPAQAPVQPTTTAAQTTTSAAAPQNTDSSTAGGSPMGFFAAPKTDTAQAPAQPVQAAATPPQETQTPEAPQKWDNLVEEAQKAEKVELDDATKNTLKTAAESTKNTLFKAHQNNDDEGQAAE